MSRKCARFMKLFLCGLLALDMTVWPVMAGAQRITGIFHPGGASVRQLQTIASGALPELRDIVEGAGIAETSEENYMEVLQHTDKAILEWETFNIGQDGHVYFNQTDSDGNPMPSWRALNRIFDANPSQIFGRLSADGKVFLINQNGFLFGPDARITNLYTLAASSLNMADNDFRDGNYRFSQEDYNGHGDDNYGVTETPFIENQGQIEVQNGGEIYLMAPEVVNHGAINAPNGHAALIAGETIELDHDENINSIRPQKLVTIPDGPGEATNTGSITAQGGIAGMYAGVVNQEGLITSVTAVYQNGTVELMASERIHTGAGSITGTPLSDSDDTVDRSFETDESRVTFGPLQRSRGDTATPAEYDYPDWIDHHGAIVSPSGEVKMMAERRIFMDEGSSIDVSGAWARRSASDNQIEMQLNSVELSDDFLAGLGSMLGETIKVNALVGTDIGHIQSHLNQGEMAVEEANTIGGRITLETLADDSDVIVKQGAEVLFAGGGINYSAGNVETSKVRIGDQIYDIGDIPEDVLEVADHITLVDEAEAVKFGSTYIPAYQEGDDAGSLSILTRTLMLNGRLNGSVIRGIYQTRADDPMITIGDMAYYTARGLREPHAGALTVGNFGASAVPNTDRRINALVFGKETIPLPADFGTGVEGAHPDVAMLGNDTTYISTDLLNAAGLGSLTAAANTTIEVQSDAHLKLAPSQAVNSPDENYQLQFKARRIDHHGTIESAGGRLAFYNDVNRTTGSSMTDSSGNRVGEAIRLHAGSVIDVSGETWNNWNNPSGVPDQMHLSGGDVLLQGRCTNVPSHPEQDASRGIYIDNGAVVNVSGGYAVGPLGDVMGGDAGELTIIGKSIDLNGDLLGHSLVGFDGGRLTIKSRYVNIIHADNADHSNMTARTITDHWIGQSGFSQLAFYSDNNLNVRDQAILQPSTLKYTAPIPGLIDSRYVTSPEYLMEATSVKLIADARTFSDSGRNPDPGEDVLSIRTGAMVAVSDGGEISLNGPEIDIQGNLVAHGGSVRADADLYDITLGDQAVIDASGYVRQRLSPFVQGLPNPYSVYGGGDVALEAPLGQVIAEDGSLIDVSGSPQVTNYYRDFFGRDRRYQLAATPGSIALQAMGFDLQGEFRAQRHMPNLTGGSLSIAGIDYADPYMIIDEDLARYAQSGFDAWTFSSISGLQFVALQDDGIHISHSADQWGNDWFLRELVLDAPMISAVPDQSVHIESVYTQLVNLDEKYIGDSILSSVYAPKPNYSETSPQTTLELEAQWMDILGSVAMEGFDGIHLTALNDMRLMDTFYEGNASTKTGQWIGKLATYADLTLTAGRIYPTTDTSFILSTGAVQSDGTWLGGALEIEQVEGMSLDGPVLSANGEVTIQTNMLTHNGTLTAPMGRILLQGMGQDNTILLGENSVLSTAADTSVPWGYYQSDQWMRMDKTGDKITDVIEVEGPPQRSIDILAENLIAREGSTIDVSGGGMVYAAQFEPSIAGSADPLTAADRYIIFPDQSVQMPGEAVYLDGVDGLETGYYSLLPYEYAFLPGAVILEDMGVVYDKDNYSPRTIAGYEQTIGYQAVMGTGKRSPEPHLYVVRSADDVLREGSFRGAYSLAGDGGALMINSQKGDLKATYYGNGLSGYDGGRAWISSRDMVLTSEALSNTGGSDEIFYFDPQVLFSAGFDQVVFGNIDNLDTFSRLIGPLAQAFSLLAEPQDSEEQDQDIEPCLTDTLVVRHADLNVPVLGLFAQNQLDIQSNVNIGSSDTFNELIMAAPEDGIVLVDDGSTSIEADIMGIFTGSMEADDRLDVGRIVAIAGTASTELLDPSFSSTGSSDENVLRIHSGLWRQFNTADHVAVAGGTDIHTKGEIATGSLGLFYLNTPQFVSSAYTVLVDNVPVTREQADFNSAGIWIANSGDIATSSGSGSGTGTMTFTADYDSDFEAQGILTGQVLLTGEVDLDGYSRVHLIARHDLVAAGKGGLLTHGDLTLSAGRVTAGAVIDDNDEYQVADYTVQADGLLTIDTLEDQTSGNTQTPGGVLHFEADTIVHQGFIDNFSGGVGMQAQNGIYLLAGSKITAAGGIKSYAMADETVSQAYGAGWVALETQGNLEMQAATTDASGNPLASALIDVSNMAHDRPLDVTEATWAQWIDSGYLDAGAIVIAAPQSVSELAGTLMGGTAAHYPDETGREVKAQGGIFDLTVNAIDFTSLNRQLDAGGFDQRIKLRAINGSIDVAAEDVMHAQQIHLVADAGTINVSGILNATGRADDRFIQLFARDDVNLYAGGELSAAGEDGWNVDGGDVIIGSTQGFVNLYGRDAQGNAIVDDNGNPILDEDGDPIVALVDVSASEGGAGEGGRVHFRARRYAINDENSSDFDPNADDVRMNLEGKIKGAREISVEAVRVYDDVAVNADDYVAYNSSGVINSSHINTIQTQTNAYMSNISAAETRLEQSLIRDPETSFRFVPGIEIIRDGNIELAAEWDLNANDGYPPYVPPTDYYWRYGTNDDVPGTLTIRASQDLTLSADLIDRPHTAVELLHDTDKNDSWTYALVSGADPGSADPLATTAGQGDLEIRDLSLVYTESGDIYFASGGDTLIGGGRLCSYNNNLTDAAGLLTSYTLATHDGSIHGNVAGTLALPEGQGRNIGAIQTATGDIVLDVKGNLDMGNNTAIRTTGVTTAEVTEELVLQDASLSWLVSTDITFEDPNSGEMITSSYFDAIYTYQLYNDPSWSWLSDYRDSMASLVIAQFNTYDHGGNIAINVKGNVTGSLNQSNDGFFVDYSEGDAPAGADMAGASYIYEGRATRINQRPMVGIATMAGGDVQLNVGGRLGPDEYRINTYDPDSPTRVPLGIQMAAFNQGDLTVRAGGSVDGRFLIEDGHLDIVTMQGFGKYSHDLGIEVIDTPDGPSVTINITAQDDIFLGSVIDPLMAAYWDYDTTVSAHSYIYAFHLTEETALQLTSLNGSITLGGTSLFYDAHPTVINALPARVALTAQDDIIFANHDPLWLTPSVDGGLRSLAGGSIIGINTDNRDRRDYAQVIVSNLAPEQIYHHLALPGEDSQLTFGDTKGFTVDVDFHNGYLPAYVASFDEWWGRQDAATQAVYQDLSDRVHNPSYVLHAGDFQPVALNAGGNIVNLALSIPKGAEVTAGEDIRDFYFKIQHANPEDLSVVAAGGQISCSPLPGYYDYAPGGVYYEDGFTENDERMQSSYLRRSGVELAGGGDLIVAAGHHIDLGLSAGLRTYGNIFNDALPGRGADMTVMAGYAFDGILKDDSGDWDAGTAEAFFDELLDAGIEYSALKYGEVIVGDEMHTLDIDQARNHGAAYADLLDGYTVYADVPQEVRDALAELYLTEIRETLIAPHLQAFDPIAVAGNSTLHDESVDAGEMLQGIDFESLPQAGDILMTQSQIYTQRYGDINTIAAGIFDVGISSFGAQKSDSGINTMRGGDINIYTQYDLNVNESRVMTWFGGDILIFADHGNINAGKGSKTTVSVSDPRRVFDKTTGSYRLEYTLPAVGSGIRLLTYDPDGAAGPMSIPDPGDGYFFAPDGEIDAGEAGIVGQGNILLSALVVTNAQNIAVSGLSSGASIAQDASGDMGSLSGAGGLADSMNQANEETVLASARERFSEYVTQLSESLVPRWLAIEVIGFDTDDEEDDTDDEEE